MKVGWCELLISIVWFFCERFEGICVDSKCPWVQFLLKVQAWESGQEWIFFFFSKSLKWVEDISGGGELSSVVSNSMGKSLGSLMSLWTVVSSGGGLILLKGDCATVADWAIKELWITDLSMGACSMFGTTLWICWDCGFEEVEVRSRGAFPAVERPKAEGQCTCWWMVGPLLSIEDL